MRSSSGRSRAALALLVAVATGSAASAHRRDEYLQAARIAIDPARVQLQLDLTPGIAVAERVLDDLDGDRDGTISPAEAQRYQQRVLGALALDVDGIAAAPRVTRITFPTVDAVRNGEGTIALEIEAGLPPLAPGIHRLHYRNNHQPAIAAYLANALVPASSRVLVRGQDRDAAQQGLTVEYTLDPATGSGRRAAVTSAAALAALLLLARVRRSAASSTHAGAPSAAADSGGIDGATEHAEHTE